MGQINFSSFWKVQELQLIKQTPAVIIKTLLILNQNLNPHSTSCEHFSCVLMVISPPGGSGAHRVERTGSRWLFIDSDGPHDHDETHSARTIHQAGSSFNKQKLRPKRGRCVFDSVDNCPLHCIKVGGVSLIRRWSFSLIRVATRRALDSTMIRKSPPATTLYDWIWFLIPPLAMFYHY